MYTNRSRNILVGVVLVIIVILVIIFLIRQRQSALVVVTPTPTPISSYQQELQNNFGITVPSTAVKTDLKDVSGGNQMGLATLDKQNGQNDYTVIANLDDQASGSFYQGWLIRGITGDANYDVVSLGQLSQGKGGWIINFNSTKDLSDHKNVLVTLQTRSASSPEKHILEGSF